MTITGWIMSIVGVAVLGILVDTIMPDGNMQKFIKSIFAIIIVFVIVAPLPGILNKDYSTDISTGSTVDIDNNYITSIYKSKVKLLEKSVESELASVGWNQVKVTIYVDSYTENMKITTLLLDLKNLVIDKNVQHIFSYEEIVDKISKQLKISKGIVMKL